MTGAADPLRRALRLLVITHPRPRCGRPLEEVVAEVVAAGATAVQLRDKEAPPRELLALARRLRAVTARHGALLIVNDRLDIALAAGADGVHLGPDDVPVAAARRVVPDGFLLGHSTDDPGVARRAEADGADYLGCGTVFPTTSKADAGAVIGVGGLGARGGAGGGPRRRQGGGTRRPRPRPGGGG
ncbi:MAG: thiamine phosphate synthase, partial [Gammaproteobacteria bacterium]|nr:thiamine phosphate synthase [Gammaproteobacteria bacterium]